MTTGNAKVDSTARSINLAIETDGSRSLDRMEADLRRCGHDLGLTISHITKLGARRWTGNRHWHLKRDLSERGCLDVTYWPPGPSLWVTIRRSEPKWVHNAGHALAAALGTLPPGDTTDEETEV